VGNIRGSVGRVRAGGGDGGGWSDSLCTKRITFISGKPRVAPNCNQFFVFLFFSRTHRSPSASLSPPPILSAVHSVPFLLVPFRTDPCLRRAGPCFVRSLARSLARSFVRSFVRSFAHSFRMAGWRYPMQPEFASGILLFAFQFRETLATTVAAAAAAAAKRRVQT